jgi:hypothetical protein
MFPQAWGARAPRVLAKAPSSLRTFFWSSVSEPMSRKCFGEAAETCTRAACAPRESLVFAIVVRQQAFHRLFPRSETVAAFEFIEPVEHAAF